MNTNKKIFNGWIDLFNAKEINDFDKPDIKSNKPDKLDIKSNKPDKLDIKSDKSDKSDIKSNKSNIKSDKSDKSDKCVLNKVIDRHYYDDNTNTEIISDSIICYSNRRAINPWNKKKTPLTQDYLKPIESNIHTQLTILPSKGIKFSKPLQLIHKHSIGIALVRLTSIGHPHANSKKKEILMINKRHTYAFSEFIHGKYPITDLRKSQYAREHIMKMLDNMTVSEKLDILSLNFDQIWYRMWLSGSKSHIYYQAKNKFESTFLVDNGIKLKKMISKSKHSQIIWEIPKGRKKSKNEPDINCAIREFTEETNIPKSSYKILPRIKKTYSFIDNGVHYIYTYYIAIATTDIKPTINFDTQEQLNEIGDIKWMDLNAIRYVDVSGKLEPFIKSIYLSI